jgi:MoxR-like ATPase
VDELDRADPDFEAFLLEVLADAAVTVPELGTIQASVPPGIDWVAALELLGAQRLDADAVGRTLGAVLKYREDQETLTAAGLESLVRSST